MKYMARVRGPAVPIYLSLNIRSNNQFQIVADEYLINLI